MTKKKIEEYEFLLRKYHEVSDYIGNKKPDFLILPDVIVSFCIFIERLLKIKLYKENPLLPYRSNYLTNFDNLVGIIKKKESGLKTLEFGDTINLYRKIFPNSFNDAEEGIFLEIYKIRNEFVHSHRADIDRVLSYDDIFTKIATVWGGISKIAKTIFGERAVKSVKPSKVYTDEDLRRIQEEEVKKIIGSKIFGNRDFTTSFVPHVDMHDVYSIDMAYIKNEQCPRCGRHAFLPRKDNKPPSYLDVQIEWNEYLPITPDVYKCNHCGLEFTRNQYEIAKRILTTPSSSFGF